jgi:polyisoprenoid-binding protein YceI
MLQRLMFQHIFANKFKKLIKMKKLILFLAIAGSSHMVKSQTWNIDAAHTNINFNIDYMMVSELEGSFKKYDAKVTSIKPDFSDAKINFNVDVNSINTDNDMRDKHLKGDDFFNAEKFPMLKFTSTSMKKISDKKYVLEGDLTIRDITKHVKFDVTHNGVVNDPWGNTKAGFKAVTKIKRSDFGLKYNAALETGEMVAGEEVTLNINTVLIKQK